MLQRLIKWKQISKALLILIFLFSTSVWAKEFNDIEHHFAQKAINTWSRYGVIKGYEGKFRPDAEITRGELAVILNRILEYKDQERKQKFVDVGEAYYTEALLNLNSMQIINGNESALRPEDKVTREEAAVILVRAFQLAGTRQNSSFQDEAAISGWAKKAVAIMQENGFIKGYQGQVFPQKTLTRGELVQMLDNMIVAYLTETGEYDDSKIRQTNGKGLILVKAPQVKIKGIRGDYEIIVSANEAVQALHINQSEFNGLKILARNKEVLVLLEKARMELAHVPEQKVRLFTDKESTIAGKTPAVESLADGIRILAERNLNFGYLPQSGISDEYKPILPDSGSSNNSGNREDSGSQSPRKEQFLPLIEGLTAKGEVMKSAGIPFRLPDELPILLRRNGENTGVKVAVTWSGSGLEKVKNGEKGRYTLYATAVEDVIIHEKNYGKVIAEIVLVFE